MSIPSHILDQLNSQADLVAIIGRHTTLKRAGREYKGCCPFHGEKSPSFYVNPQKNIYHCFGCSVGGNAIKFLRDYENLTFLEAVKELSQQTGIEVPQEEKRAVKYQRSSAPMPASQQGQNPNHQPTANQPAKPAANPSNPQSDNPANSPSNLPVANNSAANQPANTQQANSLAQNSPNTVANHTNGATDTPMASGYDDYPADYYIPDDDNPRYDDWEGFGGSGFAAQGVNTQSANTQSANAQSAYTQSTNNQSANAQSVNNQSANAQSVNGQDFNSSGYGDPSFAPASFNGESTGSYDQPAVKQEGDLYELLEQIQHYYQRCLEHNNAAKNYFLSRGLTAQTLETFGLGYAPSGWQHLEEQFPRDVEGLKALGLVRRSDSGRDYNLLRDRVIFPIRDNQGRTIGFGGRALDDTVKPKYINSSDSPVFHKQHVLYGYYEARQQRANDWLVVEGYMDVIALYQAGIYGAVASMGTAINEAQISRLLTMNPVLTLCFDGDSAGQKAAWRTLELSMTVLSDDKELRFLTLPGGHDPDTYVKANGTDAMRQQIRDAMPLSQYVFAYLSERYDLSLAEGKAKLMSQVRALTNQLPKGSSFRSLLNNDIYQKLGGRREQNKAAHDALLNFDSTLTLNFNLYLCLLYQPTILDSRPLQRLWQKSGVANLQIPDKLIERIEKSGLQVPPLPTWETIHDEHLATLVATIEKLLPYLPNDTNAASHFILANLPADLQSLLAAQWQQFYRNMVARGVLDLEFLFEELIIQLLYLTLKQQHRQSKNYLIQEILKRRWNTLLDWNKRREAEQAALLNAPIPAAPERPS